MIGCISRMIKVIYFNCLLKVNASLLVVPHSIILIHITVLLLVPHLITASIRE